MASVVVLLPEKLTAMCRATKAFERAGFDRKLQDLVMIMEKSDMVDASLAGSEQGKQLPIPSLPQVTRWQAFLQERYA